MIKINQLGNNLSQNLCDVFKWPVVAVFPFLFAYGRNQVSLCNNKRVWLLSCALTDQAQHARMCRYWWGVAPSEVQWRMKHQYNCELDALLSCGCLISGVSHRRHRNRVNANEIWWKASSRVAQPAHTSSEDSTINHPCADASTFIITAPIRHPILCSPSRKPWIIK